ncbi:PAS domain S-box protein [Flavobacterium sp. J49]|uniref:PAS domain-containing sensor histidine kinase n=1 Tax=Flavobacterium sp. J49 TaxID=2718534 RepID=UPI001593261D|nr:PAS domain-containing sensor histidine kinase [Flavobacterium sp. J49]MBF6640675.1 PAS domain S-box protein [Flavobacterium sp. J49]NIC01922.1 PAS domain S-box protein [Flavobacterium sp. J49]
MNDYQTLTDHYRPEIFFDISADLFFIAGYDGYFKKVNPAVCKLLGYTESELLSRPINEFIYPEDLEKTIQSRELVKSGKPLLHFENRYITKSGEIVWLAWTSMPHINHELVYAIAKDVTYRKKIEVERNNLLANIKKINQDLKKITYTASHDLRSPVNNLLSVFELLDVTKIQDQETIEFIDMLKTTTKNLKTTLNSYVDNISHHDQLNIKVENLSLENVVRSVLHSIQSQIKESNIKIELDFEAFDKVLFNRVYLESIFINLITNAIKYSQLGVPQIITIKTQFQNGVAQLVVADNGCGFDIDKVKDKIFGLNQKFHQHIDSHGIGLYLVYNHVTDMGGQIDVTSEIGKGTTFTISFKSNS